MEIIRLTFEFNMSYSVNYEGLTNVIQPIELSLPYSYEGVLYEAIQCTGEHNQGRYNISG